jgi:CRP-like cAMP-binding protein
MLHTPISVAIAPADFRHLLEGLYKEKTLLPFTSGQAIPMNAHELWVVCRGIVQLSTLYDNGDEALLGLASPSMPFGLPLALIRPYQATALSDVDVLRLTVQEVEESPVLAQGIFRHIVRRLQQTEAILTMIGYRRVEDRLRHLILLLEQQVGHPCEGGVRITVRLTHQQLANAIGTTRVTVTRLLNQMREEGWLTIDRHRHLIILQSKLAASMHSQA